MSSATSLEPGVSTEFYIDAPAPGLYRDVPYDTYDRWGGVRSSLLKKFNQSPLHARYAMLNREEPTEAMLFGQILHVAVLEPDRFSKSYAVMPNLGNRQSKTVRAAEDAFRAEHAAATFIDKKDYDKAISMRDAVWSHPTAKEILSSPGVNELSAVWKDKETGTVCKGRQDRFGAWANWPTVVDLKSAADASRKSFSKAISNFGYCEQAAYYLDGFDVLAPFEGDRRYVLIAVEKTPPFAVALYELDSQAIEVGRRKYRTHLVEYARCLESGVWPGLGDGCDLISLPAWDMKELEHY